jgi:hypothetical protein
LNIEPSEAPSGLPTLLYLHGGAWAVGDKSDAVAERLNADRRERVRCRERELSPYPIGEVAGAGPRREGCSAVAACECAEYGLDPDRIAIGGVSAGGRPGDQGDGRRLPGREARLRRRFDIDRRARAAGIRPNPLVHVARPRFGGCRACALAPAPRVGSEGERHD